MKRTLLRLLFPLLCFGNTPFDYDLHLTSLAGKGKRTMICFHGYGANYEIIHYLKKYVDATVIGFNFPDHDIGDREYSAEEMTFGTIDELLPALYVMKKSVLDQNLEAVDLYGFSAGGAVAVNVIGVLNTTEYDERLKEIGIGAAEKKRLIAAIQRGLVILDAPLKSMEEIIDLRGSSKEFERLAKNYRENGFRPLDSLEKWKGLSIRVLLYFGANDEVLSNRDDQLYIEKIREANAGGKVTVVIGEDGGHSAVHHALWKAYKNIR